MTNRAYNIFCAIIGVLAAFVLYKLFVDLNIGSLFIPAPEPSPDGTVSTSAMQASEVVAGSVELFLSILIAFGGVIISIVTGALKSLSRSIGIQSLWDNNQTGEYNENEQYDGNGQYNENRRYNEQDGSEDDEYEYEYDYVEHGEEDEPSEHNEENDEQGSINEERNKERHVLKQGMTSSCLEESLYIAIKSKNKDLTIALIQEMAGSNFLTGEDNDGQETTTPQEKEEEEDSSSED